MTRRRLTLALATVFVLGLAARVVALAFENPHHPDEFFQYLEPAWHHLTGAGVETWEWRRGVRSWALPGYNGAWMALLLQLGVRDGVLIATLVRLHWALLSLVLVWAGWRGGMLLARRLGAQAPVPSESTTESVTESVTDLAPAGWQGGLAGALLCAGFPWLVRFATHTFSEMASTLCLVVAMVLAGELVEAVPPRRYRKAIAIGVLLGLGVGLRMQYGPVALVLGLWLLVGRRFRQFAVVVLASIVVLLGFGLLDFLTWKSFFASYVRYVQFNILEGGAATFGTLPMQWYVSQFLHRLPYGLAVLTLACLLGLRRSWALVLAAAAVVSVHSVQAHKEERFVVLFWPLMLIAAGGYLGAWAGRATSERARWPRSPRVRLSVAAVVVAGILLDGGLHCRGNDFDLPPERFAAQAWVGRQADVTGLLYDEPLYVGGYLWFGRTLPQVQYKPELLDNPLFSHVLAGRNSEPARLAERAGFQVVHTEGDFVVLGRHPQ
jgi:GPI mannosyltransferase 3